MIRALVASLDLPARLAALLAQHPELGRGGFGDGPASDRPTLAEVDRCLAWLYSDEAWKYKPGTSSYSLKHEVERWARTQDPDGNPYTPNGAMIAALLLAEWPCARIGPNATIKRDPRPGTGASKPRSGGAASGSGTGLGNRPGIGRQPRRARARGRANFQTVGLPREIASAPEGSKPVATSNES